MRWSSYVLAWHTSIIAICHLFLRKVTFTLSRVLYEEIQKEEQEKSVWAEENVSYAVPSAILEITVKYGDQRVKQYHRPPA